MAAVSVVAKARRAAGQAAWRAAHPDRMRELRKAWAVAHPERVRLYNQAIRANRTAALLSLPGRLRVRDVEDLPLACTYCGSIDNLTLDHATPLSRGGLNAKDNLTTACFGCNRRKGDRTASEFLSGLDSVR